MKYFILVALIALAGCSDKVHNYQIDQATNICSGRKGINYITTVGISKTYGVKCNNGYRDNPRDE